MIKFGVKIGITLFVRVGRMVVTHMKAKSSNSDEDVGQQSFSNGSSRAGIRENLRTVPFSHTATIDGCCRRRRVDFAPIRLQENIAFGCIDHSNRDRIPLGHTDFRILQAGFVQKLRSNRKDW
jgi:hypothetical protein